MKPLNLELIQRWSGQFKPFSSTYIVPCRFIKCPNLNQQSHLCENCIADVNLSLVNQGRISIYKKLTMITEIVYEP